MQATSELYKNLIADPGHVKECRLIVAGEEYASDRIVSMETDGGLFEQDTVCVGSTVSRQLEVVLYGAGEIPKGAKLIPEYRIRAGDMVSEWKRKGVFYIDTRDPRAAPGTLTIHAFDDLMRMEAEWIPSQDLEFPMPMDRAAEEIARFYGLNIDPRSRLRSDYSIDYPTPGTSGRTIFKWIAAAHGGNWTMTDNGEARLVRLRDLDSETGSLVTERGRTILIGGRPILVGKTAEKAYDGPSDKVFVGPNAADVSAPPALEPISKIVILVDDDSYYEAGDDSGLTLELTCPYGTQTMADNLLNDLKGYRHVPLEAQDALIDPAAEIGDGVTVNGVYTILASMATTFDALMPSDIGAPGQRETESELGRYFGPATKEFNRKLGEARSFFIKKSNEITARVDGVEKKSAEDLATYEEAVNKSLGELQSQIDGNIMTWFYDYEPTINNEPASLWTTEAERIKHLGDVFYIVDNEEKGGQAYRWEHVGGAYRWSLIEDVEVAKALSDAAKAQDTADHKRRVFTEKPTPPYDVGDLWSQGGEGDLLRCATSRASGSYVESDWEPASKYTDDSALSTFLSERYEKDINAIKTQADQKAETWYQDADPSGAWNTDTLKAEHKGDMWYCTNSKDTHYQKFWRWSGSGWQEMTTTPPEAVFDAIDGKAQIFITEPTPPYHKGDLWFNSDSDDIMTCVADRLEGTYNAEDWEKRNKYTDKGYVNSQITLFADSIKMSVENATLGSKASITLSVNGKESTGEVDLSGVRSAFANDKSEVTINGGRVTFNSGTFVVNSDNFSVNENGDMRAESGTVGGFTLNKDTIYSGNSKDASTPGSLRLSTVDFSREISGEIRNDLRFSIGSNFGVSNNGTLYANNGKFSGDIYGAKYHDVNELVNMELVPYSWEGNISAGLSLTASDDSPIFSVTPRLVLNQYTGRREYFGADLRLKDMQVLSAYVLESSDVSNLIGLGGDYTTVALNADGFFIAKKGITFDFRAANIEYSNAKFMGNTAALGSSTWGEVTGAMYNMFLVVGKPSSSSSLISTLIPKEQLGNRFQLADDSFYLTFTLNLGGVTINGNPSNGSIVGVYGIK